MYGDQVMGHGYYANAKDDDGKDCIRVIRSRAFPEMENECEGFKGSIQKPFKAIYSTAWYYAQEKAVILTLDKAIILKELLAIEDSADLQSMTDYDFKITFDGNALPADKYEVTRLDATKLTKEQTDALKVLAEKADLGSHADGGDVFPEEAKE